MKTVFFGTPDIAVPALFALAQTTDVKLVVCQPDRPAGRKLSLRACPVKQAAMELGLPVHQPVKVRTGNLDERLREVEPDLGVVLAYGRILPERVLDAPRLGCVNFHASLLPKYRGAAPINWALKNGETETGVSLMRMDAGLDTGPVYTARRIPIPDDMDAGRLAEAIAKLCAVMVREDLRLVPAGATPAPQDDAGASFAPPIKSSDALIDWTLPAKQVHNLVRAFAPRPGAFSFLHGKRIKVLETSTTNRATASNGGEPGTVVECSGQSLFVATGSTPLRVERAQLEGKKALSAADLINGRSVAIGDRLEPG